MLHGEQFDSMFLKLWWLRRCAKISDFSLSRLLGRSREIFFPRLCFLSFWPSLAIYFLLVAVHAFAYVCEKITSVRLYTHVIHLYFRLVNSPSSDSGPLIKVLSIILQTVNLSEYSLESRQTNQNQQEQAPTFIHPKKPHSRRHSLKTPHTPEIAFQTHTEFVKTISQTAELWLVAFNDISLPYLWPYRFGHWRLSGER